jgi:hypothetical protein
MKNTVVLCCIFSAGFMLSFLVECEGGEILPQNIRPFQLHSITSQKTVHFMVLTYQPH